MIDKIKTSHTRTAKHSNQLARTTAVVTDRNDIIEHAVIRLRKICEYIDEMIGSLNHDISCRGLESSSCV